ncbi:MAG: glycosyltransferase [Pseudomonadota bacterium]
MVTNFHRERRMGLKTAAFIRAVHAHLRGRGIQLNVEFVLDRPDEPTHQYIDQAAKTIDDARVHVVDFGNLGISRTHGVKAARGDVVCFVDGDDFFSLNWFEDAFDYLSGHPRREIAHTQYMVGFDQDEFIRETMDSGDPSFDPLSLAVDWYWSANLAIQTQLFAAVPIEPYDHAGGFGSEDWHWACNCLAAGIRRAPLSNTSYFYRVKPERFSLGRVGDVIHMRSALFTREGAPPPPKQPSDLPIPTKPLSAEFFAQAREVERFELGISYLRSVEVGGQAVRHFSPHTPPIVGSVMREVLASGFGDGSTVVFADQQRLPGGLATAAALCTSLTGPAAKPRLYIVDGVGCERHSRADGYVIALAELKAAGLYDAQLDRLIARFLLQSDNLTVLNLLSPRTRSRALAYSRATRGSVHRWLNVVMEYGFDALSQAYDELEAYEAAGVESQAIGVFQKTVREAAEVRGAILHHDEALEHDYVSGALGSRIVSPTADPATGGHPGGGPSPAEARTFRITPMVLAPPGTDAARDMMLKVTDSLRALSEREDECIFALGGSFFGAEFGEGGGARAPGLRIPTVTIVHDEGQSTIYLKHPLDRFNEELQSGRFSADIGAAGALGVDCVSLREVLQEFPQSFPFPVLIDTCLRRARGAGGPCVAAFAPACILEVTAEDLDLLDKAALARALTGRSNRDAPGAGRSR